MKRLLVLAAVSAAFFCFHAHSINAADSRHSFPIAIVLIDGSPHDTSQILAEFRKVGLNTCILQVEEASHNDKTQTEGHQNLQTHLLNRNYRMLILMLCILVLLLLLSAGVVIKHCSRTKGMQSEEKPRSDIVKGGQSRKEECAVQRKAFNLPEQLHVLAEQNQPFEQKQTTDENEQTVVENRTKMYNKIWDDTGQTGNALNVKNLDLSVRRSVAERLTLLNKFVAAIIVHCGLNEAVEELRQLMNDKRQFLESTRLSFAFAHPEFIKYLSKQGLTDNEIEFCCFYTIDLNGKDIANYMEMRQSGYYKFSSNLRKKFALEEKDTNINIFLRNLFSRTAL